MPTALLASAVPVPTGPTVGAVIANCTSTTTTAPGQTPFATGEKGTVAAKLNKTLARISNAGGFVYGLVDGFALTVSSGLTLAIATGRAQILDTIEYAGGTKVLPDNIARVFIWLLQNGTISTVSNSITPPQENAVFLGSCVTSAGAISGIDTTGVCELQGNLIVRSTSDPGKPGDAPTAWTCHITKTLSGSYFWDGTQYAKLQQPGMGTQAMADANQTAAAAIYSKRRIKCTGALTAARNLVLPLMDEEWVIINDTTGGFAISVQGATGTGVSVANARTAIVRSDGTNFLRVTADVAH